ncbi:MAG: type I-MYXAN CRISPR-associated protein Cas6/Cmx6 [Gammaproteobacteria bacterium]
MLWQDEQKKSDYVVPDNVVDRAFKIDCKQVPTSHAQELSSALHALLPWLKDEPELGVHQIHGATTGNGWERPADGGIICLSKRSRMSLRVPKHRIDDVSSLVGSTFDIAGNPVKIGDFSIKPLLPQAVIFSRYVAMPHGMDENEFIHWIADQLAERDIEVRKMLCGIGHTITTGDGDVDTRSLMIADIDKPTSIQLQEQGVGPLRHLGCGIFLPHKGIRAVGEEEDRSHYSGA